MATNRDDAEQQFYYCSLSGEYSNYAGCRQRQTEQSGMKGSGPFTVQSVEQQIKCIFDLVQKSKQVL